MKFEPKFKGTIVRKETRLAFLPEDTKAYLNRFRELEGEEVEITIRKYKPYKARSNEQNSYFHGVICTILADYTGYSIDDIKGALKVKFNIKHTSDLTTAEAEDFFSKCREYGSAFFGCYIPAPNETNFEY